MEVMHNASCLYHDSCTFLLSPSIYRREEYVPVIVKRPSSSVDAFSKARGGQQQSKPNVILSKRAIGALLASSAHAVVPKTTSHSEISTSLDCGSRDNAFGWGMF